MREARAGEDLDGPRVDMHTTIRDAVPVFASSEKPVVATDRDRVAGVVDRVAVLKAIAGEGA
jgi:glycine betaine/proline transport system ATP-binding protein